MNWLENVLADGEHGARMRNDLEYFARHALKLRPKAGQLESFVFNPAQRKLHALLEGEDRESARDRFESPAIGHQHLRCRKILSSLHQ